MNRAQFLRACIAGAGGMIAVPKLTRGWFRQGRGLILPDNESERWTSIGVLDDAVVFRQKHQAGVFLGYQAYPMGLIDMQMTKSYHGMFDSTGRLELWQNAAKS